MKINTENLKEYKRVYDLTKVAGNAYYEFVYLDFEKEIMTFMNNFSIVKIQLFLEREEKEKDLPIENIFVDGGKFFFLVSTYDYLTLKGKSFYSPQNNKFTLQTLDEELMLPEKKDLEWKTVKLDFTEDFNKNLAISKDFLDFSSQASLYFEKGYMISISEDRFFQADIKIDKTSSFDIPLNVVKLIENLPKTKEDSCLIKYGFMDPENKIYEIFFKDLTYTYSSSYESGLPVDPFEQEFIDSFKHKDYFEVDLQSILENVKTLDSFVKDSTSSHCEVRFFKDSLIFYLKSVGDGEVEYSQKIEKYSDFSQFEDCSFWISLNRLKIALLSLSTKKYEKIIIRFNKDAETIYFSDKEEIGDLFIVQSLLDKPNEF